MVQLTHTTSLRAAGLSVSQSAPADWDEPGQMDRLLNDIRSSQQDFAHRMDEAQRNDDPRLLGRA